MKRIVVFALVLNAALLGVIAHQLVAIAGGGAVATQNGDTNGDGTRDLSDAVHLLQWLFSGGEPPVAIAQQGGDDEEITELRVQVVALRSEMDAFQEQVEDCCETEPERVPYIIIPPRGSDLTNANLPGVDLSNRNLEDLNLGGANLTQANFERSSLKGANLQGAILEGANLQGADLDGTRLEDANLEGADLRGAREMAFARIKGTPAFLPDDPYCERGGPGVDLIFKNLQGCDWAGANLVGARLVNSDLSNTSLQGADLRLAHLINTNLRGANLRGANLRGAGMLGADLQGADLRGAVGFDPGEEGTIGVPAFMPND